MSVTECPANQAGQTLQDENGTRGHARLLLILFVLIASPSSLTACRARATRTQAENPVAIAATPTPRAGDDLVEKKSVSLRDEAFDLSFAQERHESFALQPGGQIRIEGISGRIEVEKSGSDKAELLCVRSVEDREDIKHRQLLVQHEGNDLTIRMERVKRSALFSMFSERGREKQRVLLRVPPRVGLSVSGANGRLTVTELDGKLNVDGVNGRVMIGKIAGETVISGIRGPVRFIRDGQNKNSVTIDGIFGTLDVLLTGNVNANLTVDSIFGPIDQGIPDAIYERERRPGDNNFRARFGKGEATIVVNSVHGRVRFAPATAEDIASIALVKPGSTPEASKSSPGPSK